jgi:nicotinamidase-related amidase
MRALVQIRPATLAALFIDLQEEHRQDPRYLVAGYDDILARVARLQKAAREHGLMALHAAYVVDGGAEPFNPLEEDGTPVFSAKGSPLVEICPEVAPHGGEAVLVKAQPSVFGSGELQPLLGAHGVEWLLIAGVWTEACIDATVKDAIRAGFRVLLVKDACGSGTEAMHQVAVLNLANRLYGGAIADTDTACRVLAGEAADLWVVEGAVPLKFTFENAADLYRAL